MSNSTRCAACKSLRRRCSQDCALAPYFPANNPERFACVHRIYGVSNVTKILAQLPIQARAAAVDSMTFEANSRIQNPVYGCTQTIFKLQRQIIQAQYEITKVQAELAKVQAELAIYNAQHQMQQVQQQNHNYYQDQNQNYQAAFEQEEFQLDQQHLLA